MANVKSSIALRSIRQKLDRLIDQSLHEQIDVFLPETLGRTLLLDCKPAGMRESKWLACAYYLIERIFLATLNKDFKITRNGGRSKKWVSLPYTAFQSIARSQCGVLRQGLLDAGLLECDGSYSHTRHETYGYQLGSQFRTSHGRYRTIADKPVEALLVKHRRAQLEEQKQRISEIAFVAKAWLQPERIELDKTAALEYLDFHKALVQSRLNNRISRLGLAAAEQKERWVRAANRHAHALQQVKNWGKAPHLTVDDKGGRFYTPLSLLLSPLRHFITYDGQPLVVLDLKNSQPLHLLLLLDANFWTENSRLTWSLKKLNPALWKWLKGKPAATGQQEQPPPLIETKNTKQERIREQLTNTHFEKLVLEGKLYEFMVEHFGGTYFTAQGADRFRTRELAKLEMLRLMYFDNSKPYSPSQAPFAAFRQHFPAVARIMDVLKRRSYKDFPVLLQK